MPSCTYCGSHRLCERPPTGRRDARRHRNCGLRESSPPPCLRGGSRILAVEGLTHQVGRCGRIESMRRFGLGDTGPRRASLQPINATSNWLHGERAGEVRETATALARDLLAVLDAIRSRRAILLGASEDGPGCIQLPRRTRTASFSWLKLAVRPRQVQNRLHLEPDRAEPQPRLYKLLT